MDNIPTIIIILVLALIVTLIIRSMIIDRKKGKSSCGAGCTGCAMSELCHRQDKEKK